MSLKLLAVLCLALVGLVLDPAVVRLKDASGYKASGSMTSTVLQNGDWPTMGDIQSCEVRVYPTAKYLNQAPNPGFEALMSEINTSANWTSQGWTSTGVSAGHREITQTTEEHHGGVSCMKLTNDNSTPGTYTIMRMANRLQDCHPGETWRASVWAKGTGNLAVGIIYSYATTPPFVPQLDAHRVYNNALTSEWQQIIVDYALPAGVVSVAIDFAAEPEAGGTIAYVDDVSIGSVPAEGTIQVLVSIDGGGTFTEAT